MSDAIYTPFELIPVTASCSDCHESATGFLGARATSTTVRGERQPAFQLAVIVKGPDGEYDAHPFAMIPLTSLAGVAAVDLQHPPTDPERN